MNTQFKMCLLRTFRDCLIDASTRDIIEREFIPVKSQTKSAYCIRITHNCIILSIGKRANKC